MTRRLRDVNEEIVWLRRELAAVRRHVAIPAGAWTTVALVNSWVAYDGTSAPRHRRVVGGTVELDGRAKNGVTTTLTTLPDGARPARDITFLAACHDGTGEGTTRLDVLTTGVVIVVPAGAHLDPTGGTGWISFAGVRFAT